jgi:molybdenum cofactor cytidylyltransferase/nicotine blue oxidoreductase
MGQPKPLLRWGASTLLAWEFEELERSTVDDIVIVTGAEADDVRRSLGRAAKHCVFNQRWPQGRAGSLACGATALLAPGRATPDIVVIMNVDQPTRSDIVDRLVAELRSVGHEAVQPSYGGVAGHPVVLRGDLLPSLAAATEATLGLRGVLAQHRPHLVAMDDEPVVRIDLDTPDTLEEARRLLGVS